MRNWFRGWYITLRIMIFERETYRLLRDWSDELLDMDDFVDAPRPETYR